MSVNNGYGGTVRYTYEASPWYESAAGEDLTSIYTFTVDTHDCDLWNDWGSAGSCVLYNRTASCACRASPTRASCATR